MGSVGAAALTPVALARRLCILKGIYPHEPKHKKKVNKGSTAPRTFYLLKDIKFLLHEPIVNKFREYKVPTPRRPPGCCPRGPAAPQSPRLPPRPAGLCPEAAQGLWQERVGHRRPAEGQQAHLQARPHREGEVRGSSPYPQSTHCGWPAGGTRTPLILGGLGWREGGAALRAGCSGA